MTLMSKTCSNADLDIKNVANKNLLKLQKRKMAQIKVLENAKERTKKAETARLFTSITASAGFTCGENR